MTRRTVEESYRLSIFTLREKRLLEKEAGDWWERKSNGLTFLLTEVAINQPMWPKHPVYQANPDRCAGPGASV